MISKGTQIRLLANDSTTENGWSAKIIPAENDEEKKNKNRVSLQIDSPSNAIVSKYIVNHFLFFHRKKTESCSIDLFFNSYY